MDLYAAGDMQGCLQHLSSLSQPPYSKTRVEANQQLVRFQIQRKKGGGEEEAVKEFKEFLEQAVATAQGATQAMMQQQQQQQQQGIGSAKKKPEKKPGTTPTQATNAPVPIVSEFASTHFNLALISDPSERWRLLRPLLLGAESLTPKMQRAVAVLALHDFTRSGLKLYEACPAREHASRVVRRALACLSSTIDSHPDKDPEQHTYVKQILSLYTLRAAAIFEDVVPSVIDADLLANAFTLPSPVAAGDAITLKTCLVFLNLENATRGRDEAGVVDKLSCIVNGKPITIGGSSAATKPTSLTIPSSFDTTVAALNNLAVIHFRHGRKALAVSCLASALKKHRECMEVPLPGGPPPGPTSPPVDLIEISTLYCNAGRCLMKSGKYDEAYDMLEFAASLEQTSPLIWLRMAECASRLCVEVLPGWPQLVEPDSAMIRNPSAVVNMSWIMKGLEALDTCLTCLHADPRQPEPPLSPTRITQRKGGQALSSSNLTSTVDEGESSTGSGGAGGGGGSGSGGGDDAQALMEAAQAASKAGGVNGKSKPLGGYNDKVKGAALLLKAYFFTMQENPSAALGAAKAMLQVTSGLSDLQIAKACTYASEALARTGRLDESLSYAIRAVNLVKDDKHVPSKELAAMRVNVAAVLCARGRLVEAERELHGALVLDATSPMIFRNLLWVYLRSHRSAAAAQIVQTRRASPLST